MKNNGCLVHFFGAIKKKIAYGEVVRNPQTKR